MIPPGTNEDLIKLLRMAADELEKNEKKQSRAEKRKSAEQRGAEMYIHVKATGKLPKRIRA